MNEIGESYLPLPMGRYTLGKGKRRGVWSGRDKSDKAKQILTAIHLCMGTRSNMKPEDT